MMENSYGVGVRNRYEIFCDDEVQDPFEILRQQEEENEKRKTDKVKDKTKHGAGKGPKQVSITSASPKKVVVEAVAQIVPDRSSRGNKARPVSHSEKGVKFRQFKDVDIEDRNKKNRNEHIEGGFSAENRTDNWDSDARKVRYGPRGGRGARGGAGRVRGGADGFDTRGKREFDRQSGSDKSGVKPVEKREGGGAHNWGRMKDDIGATVEYNIEGGERSGDEVLSENPEMKEENASETAVVEKEREMTLDEWKKQQNTNRSRPTYNLRKPGEGEDGNQWKKLYILKKKAEDEEEEEDDVSDEDEFVKRGRQKQHVDIEIKFHDGQARMRGRGRGGRGSFSTRGPVESMARLPSEADTHLQQNAPKVDDWNDFPSLIAA